LFVTQLGCSKFAGLPLNLVVHKIKTYIQIT